MEPYPNRIRLSLAGINAAHDAGYTVNRRSGIDEYLFEYFDGPVTLQDEQGRRSYSGNVFILYAPGQRQYFRADGPFTHTWFQVAGAGVAECLTQYNIPVNQAVEAPRPNFLTPLLEEALRHAVRRHRFWEDAVTETCRSLFRHLARALFQGEQIEMAPYQRRLLATLHEVRGKVYQDLKRRWTVDDMAALASMSPPRFAAAYRSHFGSGPIDDLIDVRLRHAEVLLRYLPISVLDAAQLSGFNTASNFHVRFRERIGRSPTDLRRAGERPAASLADLEGLFEQSPAARRVNLLYLSPVGYWSFDGPEDEIVDDLGRHPAAVPHHDVRKAPGRLGGGALHFDGVSYAVIPEAVVDTSGSYTICAWLVHDATERMTAVSIGSPQHGACYLQYIPSDGGFKFSVTVSERDPLAIYAASAVPVEHGTWSHVAGVHDAAKREIRLYVNGMLEAKTPYATPWRATDATYFGCSQVIDRIIDQWWGTIDDIRIYDRALTDAEIGVLCKDGENEGQEP